MAAMDNPLDLQSYRVKPGQPAQLQDRPTRADGGLEKGDGKALLKKTRRRLAELQELLYAEHRHALLVILQGMDASGKDGTIRRVFGPVNPQGVRVWSFKAPTEAELDRDFLWRIHQRTPAHGMIGVFNRSHYEDVLIARTKRLVKPSVWRQRYDQINAFESLLTSDRTHVIKFMLHISNEYQARQFRERLDDPAKHWKFNPDDLAERKRWDDYMQAYEDALRRCSTEQAPWYVVPNERRWFGSLLIASVLVERLESLNMAYPDIHWDREKYAID